MKRLNILLPAIFLLLLTFSCSHEDGLLTEGVVPAQHPTSLTFDVSEEPWQDERILVTRGATLNGLKGVTGFGLYATSALISFTNTQVTWDNVNAKWTYAGEKTLLWPATPPTLYAYAPWMASPTYNAGTLTFTPGLENTTDLLWGETNVQADGTAKLNFQHALAKISFGTITNHSGASVSLTGISLTGDFYQDGKLSLGDGTWSEKNSFTPASQTLSRNPASALVVANDATANISVADVLQIPGPTVAVTFTFTVGGVEHTATVNTTLTQGRHTTFYVTIQNHFEVIITS